MRIVCLLLLFLQFQIAAFPQQEKDSVSLNYYKKVVVFLASDSLYGRAVGSVYEKKAAEFIEAEFRKSNIGKVFRQNFTCLPPDSIKEVSSQNIYLWMNNHADSTILISAHYEHLGMGGGKSRSYKSGIHNGADDNASGVALMLNLVRTSASWSSKKYNYIFVAYSAHEVGLLGSLAFQTVCLKKKLKLALVINMDMVGRYDKDAKVINVYGLSTMKRKLDYFREMMDGSKIYTQENDNIYLTDAKYFAQKGIPSLSFTTGIHNDYHKISDDEDKINYPGILLVEQLIGKFLMEFQSN